MKITELQKCISEIDADQLFLFNRLIKKHQKIIILGNGGSNAIAQHIAQDYTKVLNKRALCFADASRLTCYINDYGMEHAYEEFIKDFADSDTLVILISSSGESKNIIRSAFHCYYEHIPYIILTGFKSDNFLRTRYTTEEIPGIYDGAILDFWVNSEDYGVVEITHETILHSVC